MTPHALADALRRVCPGREAIVVQHMSGDELAGPQVGGMLTGLYRGVTILKNKILAVRQDGAGNSLVLTDPNLSAIRGTYLLPSGTQGLAVTGLTDWPAQLRPGDPTSTTPLELALVPCVGVGLCVTVVNPRLRRDLGRSRSSIRTEP